MPIRAPTGIVHHPPPNSSAWRLRHLYLNYREGETGEQMSDSWLMPKGADLLSAIRWLSQQQRHDRHAIEEAALRFDLSPLDEEFLLQHCCESSQPREK